MPSRKYAKTVDELPSPEELMSVPGLEMMQSIVNGERAGPPIGETMGFWPVEAEQGRVVFEGTPELAVANPLRTVHGGWYGAILDSCMACAVHTTLPSGAGYTTLEYKINITRAIPLGVTVQAIGIAQHSGRSTGVANGEIRGKEDGKLYATGSTTCMILRA
ncbi:PaaI family thioesterase [uncultured Pelagimonas sp.]|uniref:PaaI family thioesterase n=1 Tax=uncultured Pelagimonas sp. TaxID=1618102 RepID=UPI00262B4332|nr:PaaI family thioesterase [uncultured Pelagimonas sp.]